MMPESKIDVKWRSRVRLVNEVAEVLRERIYAGDFAPGESLRQEELAERLQVSRTPLREALRILERDGLVVASPGRGMQVVTGDLDMLLAAYEVREAYEALAARLAARRSEPVDHEALRAALDEQQRARRPWDPRRYTSANVAFHVAIVNAARNQFLLNELPIIRLTSEVFTPVGLLDVNRVDSAVAEHTLIADAIEQGDEVAAERLAREHLLATTHRLHALKDEH